jgi:hypothetical protein
VTVFLVGTSTLILGLALGFAWAWMWARIDVRYWRGMAEIDRRYAEKYKALAVRWRGFYSESMAAAAAGPAGGEEPGEGCDA